MKYNLLMVLSIIFFSVGWIGSKYISIAGSTPDDSTTIKFIIVSILLLPILIKRKELKISFKGLLITIIASFIIIAIIKSSFIGMQHGYPGMASIILNMFPPILTYLALKILDRKKLNITDLIAIIMGAIGVLIIVEIWNIGQSNIFRSSNMFFILTAFAWSALSILAQKGKDEVTPYQFIFYYSLFAAIIMTTTSEVNFSGEYITKSLFWKGMILYAFIGSTLGTLLYFYCQKYIGADRASNFLYLAPFVTALLSFIIFDEVFHISTILGIILVIISLIIINKRNSNI